MCAFSFSGLMLISSRFLQGIGSAMSLSSGMAIIISAFPPEKRGRIIGWNTTAVYVGLSAAPLLGGLMTKTLGWHSLFYINAIAGVLVIAGILYGVKAEWAEAKNDRFDITGSLIYMPSMSALMYGFSKLPENYAVMLTACRRPRFGCFRNLGTQAKITGARHCTIQPEQNICLVQPGCPYQLCSHFRHYLCFKPLSAECNGSQPP